MKIRLIIPVTDLSWASASWIAEPRSNLHWLVLASFATKSRPASRPHLTSFSASQGTRRLSPIHHVCIRTEILHCDHSLIGREVCKWYLYTHALSDLIDLLTCQLAGSWVQENGSVVIPNFSIRFDR